MGQDVVEPQRNTGNVVSVDDNGKAKPKRKKLKGKRAVVRWLKFFRWKKKKEYQRMTAEEKILYKLRKARRKEERLVQALKKLEPSETSETTHDPEVLTPEEHFYFLKMGHKCKNYVPVGTRGIFQGVILNMHLHWKKHQTLKVVVKTFTPEEVQEIAAELARLSGGIVLDIHEGNTIIMYRGKNYAQPPPEIMSPRVTLSKKKALDKSKYRDTLRAVRRYIPKLQQDLEDLQAQMQGEGENEGKPSTNKEILDAEGNRTISDQQLDEELKVQEAGSNELEEDESLESSTWSDSEDLSDIFETDSEGETKDKLEKPLYLDAVERFPSLNGGMPDDFEEHLRQIAAASKIGDSLEKDVKLEDLDEIDKIFLRASSLLKKRRR
ncbi:putative CRM domain-containing protein, chloroplastic [Cocos nucifera]|nr:putative CRM domain-containing protein, chloroplastic [Cocos nucifera]